jgi:acyl-CoA thioester hydrolase
MIYPAPHISSAMRVEDGWIDYNGHLNMAYYNILFDRAVDEIFALFCLGPDYVKDHNASFFTLEAHITYLRELHGGDEVLIHTTMLGFDEKRTHFFQELYHLDKEYLAATSEQINIHVDMAAKRAKPFPLNVLGKISKLNESHEHLPRHAHIGHVMGLGKRGS